MANMLVSSSSKSLIRTPTLTPTHTPANKPKLAQTPTTSFSLLRHLPTLSPPKSLTIQAAKLSPKSLKSLATAVAGSISLSYILPLPSLAEMEKAALFDFNLTLPIIAVEFLLLMVALDKIYYTPLGEFMDKRDAMIKSKLAEVKDTSSEVKELEEQANAVMRAARAEIAAALNKMKKETAAEVEKLLEEGRGKVEAELEEALANLEKQKEETILALDSQIAALSDDIVKKVLPTLES